MAILLFSWSSTQKSHLLAAQHVNRCFGTDAKFTAARAQPRGEQKANPFPVSFWKSRILHYKGSLEEPVPQAERMARPSRVNQLWW